MSAEVEKYLEELSVFIPNFHEYWNSDLALSNFGAESTVFGVFGEFSTLVIDQLKNGAMDNAEALFTYIEGVVKSGGEPANAACTCFLENILNQVPGDIKPESFVPFLGYESAEFCRGWDEFTGIKTRGL